jgi:hypothetical protein
MSDPRNVAHAKKVTHEKKRHGMQVSPEDVRAVQPGTNPAAAKKRSGSVGATARPDDTGADKSAVASASAAPKLVPAYEGSLVVLAKLKELEFHSRANLERLAELTLTVGDELKQTQLIDPLGEVYSAQSAFQTKLTGLIEAYKAECERMQGESS